MLEYADDRPWPGATAWSDALSREALEAIASAVRHLTGYRVSCINVVHHDVLRAVGVHGTPEQRAVLMDSHTPVAALETDLAAGEVLGRFVLVPGGTSQAVPPYGVVFDDEVGAGAGDDAWDPDDLLVAPIRDDDGAMLAMLCVDLPVDRRRPDAEVVERLERYAALVDTAVRLALQRHADQERLRLARTARQVVSAATRSLSMDTIIAECGPALLSGFEAQGMRLRTFTGGSDVSVHADLGVVPAVPAELVRSVLPVAQRAWAAQSVAVVYTDVAPDDPSRTAVGGIGSELEAIAAFNRRSGHHSVLMVPVGAGRECLGMLSLTRAPSAGRWTPVEIEVARDVGMDLGRVILNARAYDRERRALVELQALDTYKSQLVTTLSHELKTPLAAVLVNLELLEDVETSAADGRRSISAISRGAHRLVRVVDDLVLLAKVGDPGNHVADRPVDLGEVALDIVEMTATAARHAGLSVEVVTTEEPVLAVGDADELDWVVSNLVSNALKYTLPGGRIRLDVRREAGEAVICCTDDGIGISGDDQTRLFREFFRSADPATQRQPGSGLGLAIAERIVRRHGGRIEVVSAIGEGSTFAVHLPAWSAPATEPAAPHGRAAPPLRAGAL